MPVECEHCGQAFEQTVKQQETVEVDDGGQPVHIDPNHPSLAKQQIA